MNGHGDADIDGILRRIQAEVHAREADSGANPMFSPAGVYQRAIQPAALESKKADQEMNLGDLLSLRDVEFIHAAYRRVLLREPDPVGLATHLGYLRAGAFSKLDILVFLRYSEEGRRSSIRIPGLARAYWARRIKTIPIAGRLLESAYGMWRLPTLLKNVASQEAHFDFELSEIRHGLAELAAKLKAESQILEGTLQRLTGDLIDLQGSLHDRQRSKTDQPGVQKMIAELQHHLARLEFVKANRKELVGLEERLDKTLPLKADQAELDALAGRVETGVNHEDLVALVQRIEMKAGREEVKALAGQVGSRASREDVMALVEQIEMKAGREEVTALAGQIEGRASSEDLAAVVRQIDTRAGREELTALAEQIENRVSREELVALAKQAENLASSETVTALSEHVETLKTSKADQVQLSAIDDRLSECENARIDPDTVALLGKDVQSISSQVAMCRQDLRDQQGKLNIFLELARRRMPEPFTPEQSTQLVSEKNHCLDSLYVAFEDRFRGSREAVREGAKVYLPYVKEAFQNTKRNRPLLDLACGRGEWLELLQTQGYPAKGVDLNRTALQQCRELGLDVIEDDAVEYLRKQPKNAFAAVTCFHYVEHIDFPCLVTLLDEVLRVVEPGGMAIFETPNARNILVTSGDFYRDPTHKNPVFPETLESIAELRGFARSTAYCFNEARTELYPLSKYRFGELNDYVRISRDLAWIGVKAS